MVRAVVFDLDGTLVDSLADIAESVDVVLRRHGRAPHGVEAYREFIGAGIGVLVRRAFGLADDAAGREVEAWVAAVREIYAEHCLDRTALYEGIPELLAEIARRGLPMAIVSNKPDAMTQRFVEELLDPSMFSCVTGERPGLPRKPDPTGLIRAAAFMGVPPTACAMVGDMAVDIEAGRRVPMRTVAVAWGFGREDALRAAGPTAFARLPLHVLDALG